jgi:hypothetical protein
MRCSTATHMRRSTATHMRPSTAARMSATWFLGQRSSSSR